MELEINDTNDVCIKIKELAAKYPGEILTYVIHSWPNGSAKNEKAFLEKVAKEEKIIQFQGKPKLSNGRLEYRLIPRKRFVNHLKNEGLLKKTNKKKRIKIFFSVKWGLFLEDSPETGYKLKPKQVHYILNLIDGCSIDFGLDTETGGKIRSSNLNRDVVIINKRFCEKLGLTEPLIVGDKNPGYFFNTPVYEVCIDKQYSTQLI